MNNIVRTTVEALAATLGGTQSLHTNAYDEAVGLPTTTSARIARNTQLILQTEAGIPKVVDPFGGSYMMEALTEELVTKALEIIREVDDLGGMSKAVSTGMPKLRIEEVAARKQARIDSGEDVIVGVNKFRTDEAEAIEVLKIDNTEVRKSQVAGLARIRAERDATAVQEALAAITASAQLLQDGAARTDDKNLLALAIQAARVRATLGEISDALGDVFGRYVLSSQVVSGAFKDEHRGDDSEMKDLMQRIQNFEQSEGRRPRILVAKMGQDGHDRGAKVIASSFADLGFDVDVGPLFQTPAEVVQQALDADVHIIGISSQAAAHRTLVPALVQAMEKADCMHIKVVCGGVIPPEDYAMLYEAGACAVFGPGTPIMQAANTCLDFITSKQ